MSPKALPKPKSRKGKRHRTLGYRWAERKRAVFRYQNGLCYYCQRVMTLSRRSPRSATWEHKSPVSTTKDPHRPRNLALACYDCNTRKGQQAEGDFRKLFGFEGVFVVKSNGETVKSWDHHDATDAIVGVNLDKQIRQHHPLSLWPIKYTHGYW